jgi:CubicO group peptidase (beta-lactamase class C family)
MLSKRVEERALYMRNFGSATRKAASCVAALLVLCSCASGDDQNGAMVGRILSSDVGPQTPLRLDIAVIKQSRVILAVDYANGEEEPESSTSPLFEIGSLTKSVTAALTTDVLRQRRITVYTPAHEVVRDVADQSITIADLLRQTTLLQEYATASSSRRPDEVWKQRREGRSRASWRYSNTNYYLLGRIDEGLSGRKYSQLAQRAMPSWAGRSELSPRARRLLAAGYRCPNGRFETIHKDESDAAFSAGGLITTAGAYADWLSAITRPESLGALKLPAAIVSRQAAYANGFYFRRDGSALWVDGRINGYSSSAIMDLNNSTGVVLLSNCMDFNADGVAKQILAQFES